MSSTYIDQRQIILNSDNATQNNGTFLSDVRFTFVGLIQQNDADIEEITIQVQNAQIPISFYNINVYNNILNITYNATPYTLTLTRGNYNSTTLINEILAQLALVAITDITIVTSSITGIITFTRAGALNFTIESTGTLNKALGFVVGTTYTSVGGILVAPFPLNLLGILKLKIASDELNVNNYDSSVNGSLNILATIPIEAGAFGLILYDNISNTQSVLNNPILDGFDLKIYGDDNNLVNFNNVGWTISLLLSITRRRNEKSNTIFREIVRPINQIDPTFLDNELRNTMNADPTQDNLGDIPQQTHEATSAPAEDLGDSSLDLLLYNQHTYL